MQLCLSSKVLKNEDLIVFSAIKPELTKLNTAKQS